ncbi:MAG: O-antigen ligase family protein [Kiritimatiellaeota bacterium]|nr:O-antigen ligase family protein [Kiritimatiellota bacterium]
MNGFAKNVLLFHLMGLVVALAWIHGGTRPELLFPVVPWLTLPILEWLLVYPQVKKNESLLDARRRVWRALARDPLTYVAVLFAVTLVIPLFNVAEAPRFVAESGEWVASAPPVAWLPFCTDTNAHGTLLLWFFPAMIAVFAAKHGLLKKAKRILLETVCWCGGGLAVLGFAQLWSGTDSIFWMTPMESYFFSSFGYPNLAGAYFTLAFALSFGVWFQQMTEVSELFSENLQAMLDPPSKLKVNRMLVPVVLCLAAAIATLSRAAILLCVILVVVFVVYGLLFTWKRMPVGLRVVVLSSIGGILFCVTALFFALKLEDLKQEISTINLESITDRVTGREYYHTRVARAIWGDYPVFGVGGWGYPSYTLAYVTPEERLQQVGGANVHNDSLQFLLEQGVVGYGLMVMFALLLFGGMAWQVLAFCRVKRAQARSRGRRSPSWFYLTPPVTVAAWVGTTATVCHSFGDLPFRSPAVLVVWLLAFVCVTGWVPAVKKS